MIKKVFYAENLIDKKNNLCIKLQKDYSRSLRFGFLDGSLDRNPKINSETKKIIVVYTKIFKVNM